jgi:hypothetical protein
LAASGDAEQLLHLRWLTGAPAKSSKILSVTGMMWR